MEHEGRDGGWDGPCATSLLSAVQKQASFLSSLQTASLQHPAPPFFRIEEVTA